MMRKFGDYISVARADDAPCTFDRLPAQGQYRIRIYIEKGMIPVVICDEITLEMVDYRLSLRRGDRPTPLLRAEVEPIVGRPLG